MKNLLIFFVFIVMSILSYGGTFSQDGLTEDQILRMQRYAAELKMQAPEEKAKELSQWISIGEQIGKSLAGCAKELGVEVNNFVQTPVGKLSACIIVWKLLGRDVMHFGFGFFFLIMSLSIWLYLFRKLCIVKTITFGEAKYFWGLRSKKIEHYEPDCEHTSGNRIVMLVVLFILMIISITIIFS